jgi:beta-lactamase class D
MLITMLFSNTASAADLAPYFKGYDGAIAILNVDTGEWIRYNEARCAKRFSPCSTFKIPNSLIGLETGVVKSVDDVEKWDGVKRRIESWNQDHSLRSAFKESAVWYFQKLASKVGRERLDEYVHQMHYGNEDTSGAPTKFWIDDSLKISADEQAEFMRNFLMGKLPFSEKNLATMRDVMTISSEHGTTFGGKTGSGSDPKTGKRNLNWFVGFANDGKHRYVFATNISGPDIQGNKPAQQITKAVLQELKIL